MIRRPFVLSAALMSLALAACDGNNSDPTPTPSPSPSPSPSPTASPTYPALPLTAATEFFTISAATSYTGDISAGPVVLGAAGTDSRSDRVRVALSPNPIPTPTASPTAAGLYVIREANEESRFQGITPTPTSTPTPAPTSTPTYTLATPPSSGVTEFVFQIADTAPVGKMARGEFLNNTVTGLVTSDPVFSLLTRTSYAGWLRADSTAGQHRITYTTYGYATVASDMPTTGTATYTAKIVGRAVQNPAAGAGSVVRLGGTATTTINFATGDVSSTFNVTTIVGSTEAPYGTFTGTGAIAVGSNQFSGSFAAPSPIPGTFNGGFYGSRGAEIGISFAGAGMAGGFDVRAVGVVVGKKN